MKGWCLMGAMIVICVLVAASLLAGFCLYRSMKATGGCSCHSVGKKHSHGASEHTGDCCDK